MSKWIYSLMEVSNAREKTKLPVAEDLSGVISRNTLQGTYGTKHRKNRSPGHASIYQRK